MIERTAFAVQDSAKWKYDQNIQQLAFSKIWVRSSLNRGGLTPRKITREDKAIPSDKELHEILKIGHEKYVSGEYTPETCYNFDETAFTWATHTYCPNNQ